MLNLCNEVDGYVVPANYNCPGQIVVSGESEAIDHLLDITRNRKIRAMKLPVSAPFHCEMMTPAAENLRVPLEAIELSISTVPIYLNVDAEVVNDVDIIDKLILQAKSPVKWEQTLRNMYEAGVDTFVELGPGKTLSGFVRKTFKGNNAIRVFSVTDVESLESTITALKG